MEMDGWVLHVMDLKINIVIFFSLSRHFLTNSPDKVQLDATAEQDKIMQGELIHMPDKKKNNKIETSAWTVQEAFGPPPRV